MDVRGLEDCFYFLRGGCTKASCVFRHSTTAKVSTIYCQGWQHFTCYDINCTHRHTAIPVHNKPKKPLSNNACQDSATNSHDPYQSAATIDFVQSEPHSSDSTIHTGNKKSEKVRAICKYHLHGKCTKGNSCTFLHSSTQPQSEDCLTMPLPLTSSSPVEMMIPPAALESASVSSTSTSSDVSTGGGSKRKGRDILDRYSFRKTIKLEVKKSVAKTTPSPAQL